jgi:hypothetical protein
MEFQEEESVRRNTLLVRRKGEGLRSGRFLRGISARMVSQTSQALGKEPVSRRGKRSEKRFVSS